MPSATSTATNNTPCGAWSCAKSARAATRSFGASARSWSTVKKPINCAIPTLAALIIIGLTASCSEKAKKLPPFTKDLLQRSDEIRAALKLDFPKSSASLPALRELVKRSRAALEKRSDQPGRALAQVIYKDFHMRMAAPPLTAEKAALPVVLQRRSGSCVGIASVYLSLAEELNLKIAPALEPEHVFVRLRRKGHPPQNIETLRSGASYSDAWYRRHYKVPSGVSAYMRDLTKNEFRGVVAYNLGNTYRRARRRKLALKAFTEATRLFPTFAEAHANRGLVLFLLGDKKGAGAAYARAEKLYPKLPGLRENKAVLERSLERR